MDRWRKQKQIDGESARSRTKKKNCIWSDEHTLPSFSFSSFSPLHSIIPLLSTGLLRWEQKAADVTHYFQQRTCRIKKKQEKTEESGKKGGWAVLFAIFFHLQPWASRWGCRAPLAIASPSPTPCSGQPDAAFPIVGFIHQSLAKSRNMIREISTHILGYISV